ncbi:hypothetical protein HFP15_25745 [Amycolatopsis sp. K13G38]|uniref:YggT family protein n=1 Tax=Amycolatopsis acididurans TaxID=2724524 RepID=A0ABX1JDE7_9PSEU|nr:hypothetical protein [Amycolatopsis acididurans]NKQ56287.1 hypothetical protein [Amycolatopsis acididurans]
MTRTHVYRGRASAARVISGIGAAFAVVEVVHLLMVLLHANPANAFVQFVRSIADPLALFFPGLFPIANPQLAAVVTYGLAAAFWLAVTTLIARIVS